MDYWHNSSKAMTTTRTTTTVDTRAISKATHPMVRATIPAIAISTTMCLRDSDRNLHRIHNVRFENGILKCEFRDTHLSVGAVIKELKGLKTARWLDHLCFVDVHGNVSSVKKFVAKTYNLRFT